MPLVKMPDGALVEMPENPTEEQLQALQGMSMSGPQAVGKEVLRVGAKAAQGGLTAPGGLLGDIALWGTKKSVSEGIPRLDQKPFIPGPAGIMQLIQALGARPEVQASSFGDVHKALKTAGGTIPEIEPETPAGKVAGNIAEAGVANVVTPGAGGSLYKLLQGLTAGGGAETAGAFFNGSPIAKILGALTGAAGFGAAHRAFRPNAAEMVRDATSSVNPTDWRLAHSRNTIQQNAEIPSLASQNVPNSTLSELVEFASQNPRVAPKLRAKVNDVLDESGNVVKAGTGVKSRDAVNQWLLTNSSGKGLPGNATDVLSVAQQGAEKGLQQARERAGAAYGGKVPQFLNETEMSLSKFEAMKQALEQKIAQYGPTSEAGLALRKFIDTKLQYGSAGGGMQAEMNALAGEAKGPTNIRLMGWLNQLYKDMNQLGAMEGYKGLPVRDIRQIMKEATPEYNPARDAWRKSMESDYAVAANGLTGKLANHKGGPSWDKETVTPALLDEMFGGGKDQTAALRRLATDIGEDQVGALLREHIGRKLNSIRNADPTSPHKFVDALSGNPTARANVETALELMAKGQGTDVQAAKQGFWKLMDALDTTQNLRLSKNLDQAELGMKAGANAAGVVIAPKSRLSRLTWSAASTKTLDRIAEIVTSPDGLKRLETIAKEKDASRVQALAAAVVYDAEREFDQAEKENKKVKLNLFEQSPRIIPR